MRMILAGFSGWVRMRETKNESLKVVDTAITVMATLLLSVRGGTTTTIPTLARPTATMARAGLSVASLSEPALGITDTGDAVATMVAADTMAAVDTTVEQGIAVV